MAQKVDQSRPPRPRPSSEDDRRGELIARLEVRGKKTPEQAEAEAEQRRAEWAGGDATGHADMAYQRAYQRHVDRIEELSNVRWALFDYLDDFARERLLYERGKFAADWTDGRGPSKDTVTHLREETPWADGSDAP